MFRHRSMPWVLLCSLAALAILAVLAGRPGGVRANPPPATYTNPLTITIPNSADRVETFADPAVIRGNDGYYYAYATGDPLNSNDRAPGGGFNFHHIPMARSSDLVNWTYIGDALPTTPAWLESNAGLWAPDVRYYNGMYYLYYVGTDAQDSISGEPNCHSDNGIGVATSSSPAGPWTDIGLPAVYPRRGGGGCNFLWTFDPAVITDDNGLPYIYFGSYYGGIHARRLSKDGITSDPASDTPITIPNRYEAAYVVRHAGYYYLFASATDCCNGQLSGYSVFAGRATDPFGPFVDKEGISLLETRVGGTPVISMNGNRWMGPGHNAVLADLAGQDWFFYHAIDRNDAHLAEPNPQNINKRPMLMDRLDWINGWPTVRAGYWASDSPQPAPITAPGPTPLPSPPPRPIDVPGAYLPAYSDDFNGTLGPQWGWVREPVSGTYSLTEHPGFFRFRTQNADLYQENNSASVLTETAPLGDFLVETRFEFNLPPSGCCFNYSQAGMLIYQNDDQYLKIDHFSNWETRQTEWAMEVPVTPTQNLRRYGNTVLGPPGLPTVATTTTWLRIAKHTDPSSGQPYFTGYSSANGADWVRGATWTQPFSDTKIGLVSMGGSGFIADFDYVHVYALAPLPTATAMPTSTATATAVATNTATATVVPSPAASATPCTLSFSDVHPTDYFYVPVQYLACHGVISGYGDGTFRPYSETTRAQMVKIVVLGFGLPEQTPAGGAYTFADVPPAQPFFTVIETAVAHQIVSGYTCGGPGEPCDAQQRPYFRPNANVTRGQLSKIVTVAAGWALINPAGPGTFEDVLPNSAFYPFAETAACHGIISGYTCGRPGEPCDARNRPYFRQFNNATRGQIAKIVYLGVTGPAACAAPTATPPGR